MNREGRWFFTNQYSLLVCKYVITHYQVVNAVRSHLFPFRTEKLSSLAPMVLQCGRVGSRLLSISEASITKVVGAFLFFPQFCFLIAQLFPTAPPSSFTFLPFYFFTFIYFSLKNYGESSLVMFKYKMLMNGGFVIIKLAKLRTKMLFSTKKLRKIPPPQTVRKP